MKFGLMFLSEFVEIVILGAVITAVFLGGWHPIVFEGWLQRAPHAARASRRSAAAPSSPR